MISGRIILVGGAGLVGQNLIVELKEAGYRDIVILDKHRANLDILRRLHPELRALEVDLAQSGNWQEEFSGTQAVVMLQAQIGGTDADAFTLNNIRTTENILAAMRKTRVPYLVHISSSVVNSQAEDFYAASKRAQEKIVLESGVDAIVLRPTLMFGWFDRKHLGWLSRFMKKMPVMPVPGSGRYIRQPLYVRDFCRIIMACLAVRKTGGVFNISGHEKIFYIDILREIKKAIGLKTPLLNIPYHIFYFLLWFWALFDKDPPFTVHQLKALVIPEEFEIVDWPGIFGVSRTPFKKAIQETFCHPLYSDIVLEF